MVLWWRIIYHGTAICLYPFLLVTSDRDCFLPCLLSSQVQNHLGDRDLLFCCCCILVSLQAGRTSFSETWWTGCLPAILPTWLSGNRHACACLLPLHNMLPLPFLPYSLLPQLPVPPHCLFPFSAAAVAKGARNTRQLISLSACLAVAAIRQQAVAKRKRQGKPCYNSLPTAAMLNMQQQRLLGWRAG